MCVTMYNAMCKMLLAHCYLQESAVCKMVLSGLL